MRKYHHLGIPTTEKREGEVHLKHLKIYVSGYKESPYHIEWMRYEPDAPYPELVKAIPHVAFEVDDLEQELKGKKVIIEPNSPSPGVTVAFIEDNGHRLSFYRSTRLRRMTPNQSMKPTAPLRDNFSVLATTPCRGLSLSR
jgi:hypothetical protein